MQPQDDADDDSIDDSTDATRRRLLRVGALGTGALLAGGAVGSAAGQQTGDSDYGGGNAIGAFLNEEAAFKRRPIWDGGVADRTGEDVVEVTVGAMTSIDVPDPDVPDRAPFAFAPRAVKVSRGTTIRWIWVSNPFDFPIPHDVTSLDTMPDGSRLFSSGLKQYTDADPTFEHTFDERDTHLYFCTPHGAPFEVHGHVNAFGMRGAIIVAGE
ncbi:MAG: plastocyanin/azurin family copper-binding protein [Halobacteriaceae archaeon]